MFIFGICCFFIAVTVALYEWSTYKMIDDYIKAVVGITSVVGVLFVLVGQSKTKNFRLALKRLTDRNRIGTLLYEFENAGRAFGDSVILGDTFIIGKGMGVIVQYSDIRRVYQYVHSTNGIEDTRLLRAELVSGREADLFMLPHSGKGDEELNNVINYMCSINPRIKVGYNGWSW